MLLKINLPSPYEKELWQLTRFIVAILHFCHRTQAHNGEYDIAKFKRKHPKLRSCYLLKQNRQQIQTLKEKIEKFFSTFTEDEQREILYRIKHDIRFDVEKPSQFQFKMYGHRWGNEKLQIKVKDYFTWFYTKYFDKVENYISYRDDYKHMYRLVNLDHADICPACLGLLNIDVAELDHYFPKSIFPALVVHPFNLVLVCKECNSARRKGNRIPTAPMSSNDASQYNERGKLHYVFLPFKYSGQRMFRMKVTEIAGQRKANLVLLKKYQTWTTTNKRLKNHVDTYQVNDTWSKRFPVVHKQILALLTREFRQHYINGQSITQQQIQDCLWEHIIRYSDKKVYMIDNYFILVNYAIWLRTSEPGLVALNRELIDWLAEETSGPSLALGVPHFYEEE